MNILVDPPAAVQCVSGQRLNGEQAYQAAESTFEYYCRSTNALEELARLSIAFHKASRSDLLHRALPEKIVNSLVVSRFLKHRFVGPLEDAVTLQGLVSVNMVDARLENETDVDVQLVEPFITSPILNVLNSKKASIVRYGDIYDARHSRGELI